MKKKSILFAFLAIGLCACNSNSGKNENDAKLLKQISSESDKKGIKVKLPSPVEFYLFIRESKAKFNSVALNKTTNSSKYISSTKKAINFGVYASDLAYCTVYEQQQESNSFFRILKSFAGELGVNEGYDKSILSRLDKNLNNSDSLYQITNDSYWKVCNYLEENNKSHILGPILIGGWIESLYLGIGSVDSFSQEHPIVQRITEQRYVLENLLDYLTSIKKNKELDPYILELQGLQSSFVKLTANPGNVLITKGQYKEIGQTVISIRNHIVE